MGSSAELDVKLNIRNCTVFVQNSYTTTPSLYSFSEQKLSSSALPVFVQLSYWPFRQK